MPALPARNLLRKALCFSAREYMISRMSKARRKSKIGSNQAGGFRSKCAFSSGYDGGMGLPVPVEYAVAVDQYLDQARLSSGSRRVYQISLASWAWPLV